MLTLYKNITPNYKSTYYYFKVLSKFLSFLSSYKHDEIDAKNYTIVRGSIRVKMDDTKATKLSNYKNVTYVYDDTSECFYHVNNAIVESGYVFFSVSLDNFATYFYKAKLSNINVRRCNRKISEYGIYDEIANTKQIEVEYLDESERIRLLDSAIVFSARYNSGIVMFYISLTTATTIQGIDGGITQEELKRYDPILLSSALVGGIHKIAPYNSGSGSAGTFHDAEVLNAWILPIALVEKWTQEYKPFAIKSHGIFTGNEVTTQPAIIALRPSKIEKVFTFDNNIQYGYTFGVINDGVKVTRRTTKKLTARYVFMVGQNEIKVIVGDGNTQKDITSAFTISITKVNEQANASNKIANVMSYLTGAVQIGVGIASESPLSVVRGIGRIGTQIEQDIKEAQRKPNYSIIGGGDGSIQYAYNDFEYIASPYRLNKSLSYIDENKRARKTGASFNEYVNKLSDIFTYELLGSGSANDDTFLQATLKIDSIPTSATEDIETLLASGINLQYIQ